MQRLLAQEAMELIEHADILELGQLANEMRDRLHPGNIITFVVDRNINYTNVCLNECRFCAFFKRPGHQQAYILSNEEILQKVREAKQSNATQIMLQGGLHPDLPLEFYTEMLSNIKNEFPDMVIHSFSPAEIQHLAKISQKSIRKILIELRTAGLDSLPGGGAEILVDRVRQLVSPKKIMTDDWLQVMRTAQELGMGTTATMVLGLGETLAERLEHMEKIRQLQDETGGFRAFIMWTYQPGNTQLGGHKFSSWKYLKTLATARLFFDNIKNVQGSWVTQGQQIGQMTLAFGANDLGSIMLEENVVRATGTSYQMSINKMVHTIAAADKIPAQRDTEYHILRTFK